MSWYRYWSRPPAVSSEHVAASFHVKPSGNGHATSATAANGGSAGPRGDEPPGLPRPCHVVVVANQKGGVGKTTTSVSVAASMAQQHVSTLLIDLDPQGNASSGLGRRPIPGQSTIYDVMVERVQAADAVVSTDVAGLDLVPSNIDLTGAEIELVAAFSREQRLRRTIEPLRDIYDLIVIDCPPSLGLLTVNALTAGTHVLIPIQCEYYALEGLGGLGRNVELVGSHLNPGLRVVGYAMTMFDGRTRLSEQVVGEVKEHFGEEVFASRIPRSIRLAEAPSFGQPITHFDPGSRGAVAYHRLTSELLQRLRPTAGVLTGERRT